MVYAYSSMEIDDYDEIYSLWESVPGIGLSSADSRDAVHAYLSRNPGQSFVCKAGGQIVGTILCGNDGRRAYIHHTAVAEKHRRRGIAKQLVRLAMDSQRERGIKKCHLFIFNENEPGQSFWRETGFTVRRDIGIMSRDL